MPRSTLTSRIAAAAAVFLVSLLLPAAARAQRGGAQAYANPATMPTATGMLYGGTTLEVGPDGHFRMADYPTVTRVDSGSLSARAGFQVGDVLLSVNGKDARQARPFKTDHGEKNWVVRIRRGTEEKELTMEFPPAAQPAPGARPSPRR